MVVVVDGDFLALLDGSGCHQGHDEAVAGMHHHSLEISVRLKVKFAAHT